MTKHTRSSELKATQIDWLTFLLSGGFLVVFVLTALIDIEGLSAIVGVAFLWSTSVFGAYWQLLLLLTFAIGLALALSGKGRVRLGGCDTPEISAFKWVCMILCTLLAGGGVFFAAAEPMAHFVNPPPLFDVAAETQEAVYPALAQSFLHWGFLAWAILGSLTTIVLMHLHYDKGLPLKPRTLLYPVFGDRVIHSWIGSVVDAACVISVVAGTVGPIGFLGLQVSYGLSQLLGSPDNFNTQFMIILALIGVYTVSTVTGIQRGIQILSKLNVQIAVGLMLFLLIAGPTAFIFESYLRSAAVHLQNFLPMAVFRGDPQWLDSWTVFFWGWFLGYGPLMAIFIARISRGRSIRELVVAISIISPIITTFWFTIVGGSGLAFELAEPGVISIPFTGSNMPAALLAITQQLPLGEFISAAFLILTFLFVATTGDSMTYTISIVMTGGDHPPIFLRVFWGVIMGAVAMILVSIGAGGISALQSFIVVTAVPVSLILLPSLWAAPRIAYRLAQEQGLK